MCSRHVADALTHVGEQLAGLASGQCVAVQDVSGAIVDQVIKCDVAHAFKLFQVLFADVARAALGARQLFFLVVFAAAARADMWLFAFKGVADF